MADAPLIERLALIGIGLIGSSLARVAKEKGLAGHIAISSRTAATLARAEELATRFDVLSRGVITASGTREDFKNSNLLDFYKKALEM